MCCTHTVCPTKNPEGRVHFCSMARWSYTEHPPTYHLTCFENYPSYVLVLLKSELNSFTFSPRLTLLTNHLYAAYQKPQLSNTSTFTLWINPICHTLLTSTKPPPHHLPSPHSSDVIIPIVYVSLPERQV